jgi:hypothetical protein
LAMSRVVGFWVPRSNRRGKEDMGRTPGERRRFRLCFA